MSPAPALPQHPGLDRYCELADSLHFLGCRHVLSFLLAGQDLPFMVIDGVWIKTKGFSWQFVDASYLENVRLAWGHDSNPRRRAAASYVIDVLQQALVNDTLALRRLALFQMWKLLCGGGTGSTSPQRLRMDTLAAGVAQEEADLLVSGILAVRDGLHPETVEAVMRARWLKQLRAAAHFADLLDPVATDDTLRSFLAAVHTDNRRVDDILTEAVGLERAGALESAAEHYLRAAVMVRDEPEIGAGLQRCPPPPPRKLEIHLHGNRVELRWAPAETLVGALSYRVTRVSAAGHILLCEMAHGAAPQAADTGPPLGPQIAYQVTTVRDGRVESAPVTSKPLRVVPAAEDVAVLCNRHGAAGSWRVPEGAVDVRVTRRQTRPDPGPEIVIKAARTHFHDPDVLPDRSYEYLVACGYRDASGESVWSAERTKSVDVCQWPQPVTQVQAAATTAGDGVVLRWHSPGAGTVTIVDATSPAPTPETDVAATAVSSLGTVCWQGQAGAPGSGMQCEIRPLTNGLHHLVMVTILDDRAVIGATVTADVLEGPHHPACKRSGDTVELSWEWPPELTQTLVRWSYPDEPPRARQPLRVTLDGYRRRGVKVPARDSGCTFTITPLSTVPGCISVGAPAVTSVSCQYEISYQIRRGRRHRLRSVSLRISGTAPVSPMFRLVARPGTIRPTHAEQGFKILEIGTAQLPVGRPTEHQINPLRVQPPYYLRGFVTGPGREYFRLAHPPPSQLLVEG
jgi:hypothetical protein